MDCNVVMDFVEVKWRTNDPLPVTKIIMIVGRPNSENVWKKHFFQFTDHKKMVEKQAE